MSTSAKMGPNNASGVVWALGIRDVFFPSASRVVAANAATTRDALEKKHP